MLPYSVLLIALDRSLKHFTPRLAFLGSQGRAEGRGGKTTGVAFVESSVLCTEPRVHIFLFALTLTPQPQFIDEEAVQGLMGE